MKRDYKEGIKSTPIFFTGTEVEHTPAFGLHTLFVVDIQDPQEVVEYARGYDVQHVYLGANHSTLLQQSVKIKLVFFENH